MFKKKLKFSMPTLCAFVWFGHACGASMTSGRMAVQYCSRHGAIGILSAIYMWMITVGFSWILIEYGRLVKANNYKDVVSTIYWPNKIIGKIMLYLWDFITLYSTIITVGSCMATTSAALNSSFGLSKIIRGIFFLVCILILFLGE